MSRTKRIPRDKRRPLVWHPRVEPMELRLAPGGVLAWMMGGDTNNIGFTSRQESPTSTAQTRLVNDWTTARQHDNAIVSSPTFVSAASTQPSQNAMASNEYRNSSTALPDNFIALFDPLTNSDANAHPSHPLLTSSGSSLALTANGGLDGGASYSAPVSGADRFGASTPFAASLQSGTLSNSDLLALSVGLNVDAAHVPNGSASGSGRLGSQSTPVDVLTFHNDNFRTGANTQETSLTPANVNPQSFGHLFSYPVDGYVYAQPLYKANLKLPDGTVHNVTFVATEHDSVYAFDADNPASNGDQGYLWKTSFIDSSRGITTVPQPDTNSTDVVPEVGITGTPVIDATTNTLYVVAKTKELRNGVFHWVQRLYALDITDGSQKGVVTIGDTTFVGGVYTNVSSVFTPGTGDGSVNGIVVFNSLREFQRPGLVLSGGVVYVSFASHGDNGPYHGWVVGYDAQYLFQRSVFDSSPNGGLSGIWQSGGAPAVDQIDPSLPGNLIFSTGNGTFDAGLTGSQAVGPIGAGLGYGGPFGSGNGYPPIQKSVAVKFDAAANTTGIYTNGQNPTGGISLTPAGINFNAGAQDTTPHTYQAALHYDGSVLIEDLTDMDTGATVEESYQVDIPTQVGQNTAFVGFTAGTSGTQRSIQDVQTWEFDPFTGDSIDHTAGFGDHSDVQSNGDALFPSSAPVARLTDGGTGLGGGGEAGSVFSQTRVDVRRFDTNFTFQMRPGTNPIGSGLTFTIQNAPGASDYGESVVKLSPNPDPRTQQLPVLDYFTPFGFRSLNIGDTDLGSGAVMLLPDQKGDHPHLAVETGKSGNIYLIDRDTGNLGKFTSQGPDNVVQVVPTGVSGVWASPAFWNNRIYYQGSGDTVKAFTLQDGQLTYDPTDPTTHSTASVPFPGTQPTISADGDTDGIVWTVDTHLRGERSALGNSIVHAFDATDLSHELWSSGGTGQRDLPGDAVKFVVPIISNGHVYVGTQFQLDVYGLFPDSGTTPDGVPSGLAAQALSPTQIQLNWTNKADNATGVKILRSTDGKTFQQVNTVPRDATTFTDTGLTAATTYYYEVVATNQYGDSDPSDPVLQRTPLPAPVLRVADVRASNIDLSWTGVADDHYEVDRSFDGVKFEPIAGNLPPDQTSFTDPGLDFGSYFYRVEGFDAAGDSSSSANVRATVGPTTIDHSIDAGAFSNPSDLQDNGSAKFVENDGRLTDDLRQAGSFFSTERVGIRGFTTTFEVRVHEGSDPRADGFTFILQGAGPDAVGANGSGLGFQGIANSAAVKFSFFPYSGDASGNMTGFFMNGQAPRGGIDLNGTAVNLNSQSTKQITLSYSGTTLSETILDEQSGAMFEHDYTNVNLPNTILADTAYVGFAGSTHELWSLQDILSWTYTEQEDGLPPRAPSGLHEILTDSDSTTFGWNANNAYTADGFIIERSTNPTSGFAEIGQRSADQTTFTDTPPSSGLFYYRVRSFNADGTSNVFGSLPILFRVAAPAAGYWRFDEGSGTTARDASANHNDGSFQGGVTWVPGRFGSAVRINGVDGVVVVPNSASLNPTTAITISAWINAETWDNGNERILQKGDTDNQYRLLEEGGVLKFDLSGVGTITTALPSTGVWHQITATYDGTTMKLYMDGTVQVQQAAAGLLAVSTSNLNIGSKTPGGTQGNHFQGAIDDVRVYGLALNADYIQYLQHWVDQDVGDVGAAGSTVSAHGSFAVTGAGADVGGTADAFHFAYQTLPADGEIVARVSGVQETDPLAKAGVMIRESLSADARNAFLAVTPEGGIVFQNRTDPNADTNSTTDAGFQAPYWLRLVRRLNVFTAYRSDDGATWVQVGDPVTIDMTGEVLIGLAVTSRDTTQTSAGTFDNVTVMGGR